MASDKRCFNSNGRFGRFFAEMAPWVVLSIAGCRRRLSYVLTANSWNGICAGPTWQHVPSQGFSHPSTVCTSSFSPRHLGVFITWKVNRWELWDGHGIKDFPSQGQSLGKSLLRFLPFHGIVSKAVLCIETKYLLVVVELLEVSPSG